MKLHLCAAYLPFPKQISLTITNHKLKKTSNLVHSWQILIQPKPNKPFQILVLSRKSLSILWNWNIRCPVQMKQRTAVAKSKEQWVDYELKEYMFGIFCSLCFSQWLLVIKLVRQSFWDAFRVVVDWQSSVAAWRFGIQLDHFVVRVKLCWVMIRSCVTVRHGNRALWSTIGLEAIS